LSIPSGFLRVGELAKAVGKTVRAIHLYEELGLVRPVMRTEGGFRLYEPEAENRITWIIKLQAIGFTLAEIQGFVKAFERAPSGREATGRARDIFTQKLTEIRAQISQLRIIENDLTEALDYLEACQDCSPQYAPTECNVCQHHGHERGNAPPLFASLSESAAEDASEEHAHSYDVPVKKLGSVSRRTKAGDSAKQDSTDKGSN
jgi:MerR family copper efflux transcriptional regulator